MIIKWPDTRCCACRGGAVERGCLVRIGDELEEVAADSVSEMPPEVVQSRQFPHAIPGGFMSLGASFY